MDANLPILKGRWQEVMQQLHQLKHDIERNRCDALAVVAIVDGRVELRGLGAVDSLEKALAALEMGAEWVKQNTSLGAKPRREREHEVQRARMDLIVQSREVMQEVPIWNGR